MRKVVVTGCFGGIGSAICRYFADSDWQVIGTDVKESDSLLLRDFYKCNLENEEEVVRNFEEISRKYRNVDALVNNAAVQSCARILDTSSNEWDRMFKVNVRAPFLAVKYLHENLKRAGGAVVNVGSIVSKHASKEGGVYATTKGAINSMTRALALELAEEGIRFNAVLPGAIRTQMLENLLASRGSFDEELKKMEKRHLLGRIGTPEDIAKMVYFLSDNNFSSYITGQEFIVDGGVAAMLSSAKKNDN